MPCRDWNDTPSQSFETAEKYTNLCKFIREVRPNFPFPSFSGTAKQFDVDFLTDILCGTLKTIPPQQIKDNYSLELQSWWRDHKIADKLRKEAEARQEEEERDRIRALAKLTARERRLLGVK